MRFFNTTGPVVAADHYCIPPLTRLDLDELLRLVRDKRYFVLHAPRQTGKTSALLALRDRLNADGYRCVYVNVEAAQTAREDVERAVRVVLGRLASGARMTLGDEFLEGVYRDLAAKYAPDEVLIEALARWAEADPKPLVLLIDEIDMLIGDSLLSVLRQLRTGYHQRPRSFPQSVVLCGVRDVRDYRIHSGSANAVIAGGSAFNVKAESLRLGDFSRDEVLALVGQHTSETGQAFTAEALETTWSRTLGQPWLVNALEAAWYVDADGGLNVRKLLEAFQTFFRAHSEHWSKRFLYQEAWPQLLLQAFLHRIVNSGGRIEREYGLGRGRTDLLIVWPRAGGPGAGGASGAPSSPAVSGEPRGEGARADRIVIECKVLHGSLERTIADGLEQTAAYMDRRAAIRVCRGESSHPWKVPASAREEPCAVNPHKAGLEIGSGVIRGLVRVHDPPRYRAPRRADKWARRWRPRFLPKGSTSRPVLATLAVWISPARQRVDDHARQRERRLDSALDLAQRELEVTPRAAGRRCRQGARGGPEPAAPADGSRFGADSDRGIRPAPPRTSSRCASTC